MNHQGSLIGKPLCDPQRDGSSNLLLGVMLAMLLGGCATYGTPHNMTAEQIKEWAKDKNANVICIVANTPYGKGSALYLTLDKGVVMNGSITISDACVTTITTEQKAKP